ncbi:MAG: C25 family cysteine peptidase [Ignavibacteriales bacterium]|nr:C25 family cysteine peptidase [Ignavibacteriales bacterium]
MKRLFLLISIILLQQLLLAQSIKVLESNAEYIKVYISFDGDYKLKDTLINNIVFQKIEGKLPALRMPGEPELPNFNFNLGIPFDAKLSVNVINNLQESFRSKFIIPCIEEDSNGVKSKNIVFNKNIYNKNEFFPNNMVQPSKPYQFRFAKIVQIAINPFQFNPVTKELIFHKNLTVQINYNSTSSLSFQQQSIADNFTEEYIKANTLNPSFAKNWIGKENINSLSKISDSQNWYNPNKKYLKIYLKEKGVYRVTYEQLLAAGLPSDINIQGEKIELFNYGKPIPIEVVGNKDGNFGHNSYFQFVGSQPKHSPNSKLNIYNRENVYWFSYEADTSGYRYKNIDGYPKVWDQTIQSSYHTNHYEVDSIYERLGLAPNDKRDYWFWGRSSGQNGVENEVFVYSFPHPKRFTFNMDKFILRVNMHGMTDNASIYPDHKVKILLSSQPVGDISWDGQNIAEFEKTVPLNEVGFFATNNLQIVAKGDISADPFVTAYDEIRVNWFELEYLREHRADSNYFDFISSPGINGNIRFNVFGWKRNNMNVFIPQKGFAIKNPQITNDKYQEVLFTDSVKEQTEYFCYSNDFFMSPDSITSNINSNLHDRSIGADYIIIIHSKFRSAAERLASFRSNHLKGFSSPRIKIVDIAEIYNEFSFGMLDPYAVRDYIKYAYENYTKPAPVYIALMGDMSWDYRGLLADSRKNYIPSIPYHSYKYGQAVSDNMFAAVSGDDVIPDLAIGRLSCETVGEANILVDKILNYPADNSKAWKQKVLLIGAGESVSDENDFGFNTESKYLENKFLKTNGFYGQKVFRYPAPGDNQFFGERPEIRDVFNKGCVMANFYGHGGGYQWDFVFLNDDIYLLQNENRLPMIFSVTCYTAHFDNQNVFGEQFNKVPGKGSIGFIGNTGITYWLYGVEMNNKLFNQIFNKQKYIIGDALLFAKSNYTNLSVFSQDQIALSELLADPALELALPDKPDFIINASSISINPTYPITKDTVMVKVRIDNVGRIFPNDSVTVQLFALYPDSTFNIGSKKLGSFGEQDSVIFSWIPTRAGLVNLKVDVNLENKIEEIDFSDNSASNSFVVFNMSEPNILKPFNGYNTSEHTIKFSFADIGYYISKPLVYFIEIDTTLAFTKPVLTSTGIIPTDGMVDWTSPSLQNGNYFWRAKMLDNQQYSKWTTVQTFSISSEPVNGYAISGSQFKLFDLNNVVFSDGDKSLSLNTSLLPPKPSNQKFIEDLEIVLPISSKGISSITTDGNYIYFGSMAYYGGASKIYKIGTGYNNTEKGKFYGEVSDKLVNIWDQIFYHSDGYIYIPDGDAYSLVQMDPLTGDTSRVKIPDGLLNSTDARIHNGAFYLASDGHYVYNLAYRDSLGNLKYTVRVLEPSTGWKKVRDFKPSGESFVGFSSFFVTPDYIYTYENFLSGWMRKIQINNGEFIDEWVSYKPFQGYYAWCYDWINDVVYGSVFRNGFAPKISKFAGTYKQANGSITSQEVGPAVNWKKLTYSLESNGTSGIFNAILQGLNSKTKLWDTLSAKLASDVKLDSINSNTYPKLRVHFNMVDSSLGATERMKLKNLNIQYTNFPEIALINKNLVFNPDSSLQGFPITMKFKVKNYGYSVAENLKLNFYLDAADSSFYSQTVTVPVDSIREFSHVIQTTNIVLKHQVKATAVLPKQELFTFNNIAEKDFYIVRDSIKPVFSIKFDNQEILDGDIVSSNPEIMITLKDNSPLPLSDTSRFFIFHNNEPLSFKQDSLNFSFSEYPNNQATIIWKPRFNNGKHIIEVLAKDASGNFFDTTAYSISFLVNSKNDIFDVYNFPNPFKDDTYFTFNVTGRELPDDFRIKVFTVAGRLIRDISVPSSELRFGFNKIYWNGKDQDENILANGVYFYKIISRNKNVSKTIIQKLAKVK